jgi:hypothetical protein
LFFRKSEIQLAILRFIDGESCGLKPLRSTVSGTIKAFSRASGGKGAALSQFGAECRNLKTSLS